MLYIVVCGAGPAGEVGRLVDDALRRGWAVRVIATPTGLAFLDVPALEAKTGNPIHSQYRSPDEPDRLLPDADAIICAPATFNTINKWALGISDTYALGILAEYTGLGIPIVALPFVNAALTARRPFQTAVQSLRDEGVRVLLGPGGFEPHPPRTGGSRFAVFPWALALDEVDKQVRDVPGDRAGR